MEKTTTKRKVIKDEIITTVDYHTGEITKETNKVTYSGSREPDYVKLYLLDLSKLHDLPNSDLLFVLIRKMNYDGEFFFVGDQVKDICKELKIKDRNFWYQIKNLCNSEIIFKRQKAIYYFNPYLIAKGGWKDIETFRMTVDYTPNGRTITTKALGEKKNVMLDAQPTE